MGRREWTAVDFTADILDARDLVARFNYCAEVRDDLVEAVDEARDAVREAETDEARAKAEDAMDNAERKLAEFDNGETEEGCDWVELNKVEDEINEAAANGGGFIAESYFRDYVIDLVADTGGLPKNLPSYLADNIDWHGVAEDLKVDYTEIDMGGNTWLYRA